MNAMLQKLAWQKSSCTGTRNKERAREIALWGSACRASMRMLVRISVYKHLIPATLVCLELENTVFVNQAWGKVKREIPNPSGWKS